MKNKILIAIVGALVAISSFLMGKVNQAKPVPQGSVTQGQEYFSTTTGAVASFPRGTVLRSPLGFSGTGTPTVLGSVIITTTGTSPFCLYDATSTVTNAEWATTTIACWPASPTVGTYTFDIQAKKGILFDPTGSVTTTTFASTTFTYR